MKTLRIHYLQHVPFEGLGYIDTWIKENNHTLTVTKFFEHDLLPNINSIDWLVVMGGPMGVYDTKEYPWLVDEINFIKKAIEADKTIIGICLGAQLIAASLGAKVYPNHKKEIGWLPLVKTNLGKNHPILSTVPHEFTTFHWHGDTFEMPKDAVHLLQSPACAHQAFLYNEKVIGLQFHVEVTPQTLVAMTENCGHELIHDDYIQSKEEILSKAGSCTISNQYLNSILSKLSGD